MDNMKKRNKKYYVLYDYEDVPILYFETLKEFANKLGYSYKYLKNEFSEFNEHIELNINNKKFKLYKFID